MVFMGEPAAAAAVEAEAEGAVVTVLLLKRPGVVDPRGLELLARR